jgi:folate-binding protein YgfZ
VPIALPSPQLLELSGIDARSFAHAQFANDVLALQAGHWQWNAWLSAQGRVRHLFALLRTPDERLLLWLRGGSAEAMRAELARFVFRAKVALRVCNELQAFGCDEAEVFAAAGSCPEDDTLAVQDQSLALRLPHGARWLLLASAPQPPRVSDELTLAQWQLDDIHAGLPWLAPELQDQLLPQWLGLERFNAFSVAKGCYPGQEVMARLHFKGGNKRWLYRIACGCEKLPAPGSKLKSDDAESGIIVNATLTASHRAEALAVLSDTAAAGRLCGENLAALYDVQVISRFS